MEQRELKFRVWDGEYFMMPDQTFDDECFIALDGQLRHVYEQGGYYSSKDTQALKGEHTIEQYIGLKDKNGKQAFVGDIVKEVWLDDTVKLYRIIEVKGGFAINMHQDDLHNENIIFYDSLGDMQTASWFEASVEVIGNIHESLKEENIIRLNNPL